jgi:predicted RNA-binding Zn-ribbon protein involved in translation (DUF1610 family)
LLHIIAEGRYDPMYWMHLQAPAEATLTELDDFLRWTWLECCGHLSAFDIGGTSYMSYMDIDPGFGFDAGDISMRGVKLNDVLAPGEKFLHQYDFGTTTELRLRTVSAREGQAKGKPIEMLARNEPPEIPCSECGQRAIRVCSICSWEGSGWLCAECAQDHECGEEMLLPVVNSPRVGMCAYTG